MTKNKPIMTKLNKSDDFHFWKKATIKAFVTFGVTFFSVVASIGFDAALEPSLIAAGSYLFLEAAKYYKVNPQKKVLKGTYTFII